MFSSIELKFIAKAVAEKRNKLHRSLFASPEERAEADRVLEAVKSAQQGVATALLSLQPLMENASSSAAKPQSGLTKLGTISAGAALGAVFKYLPDSLQAEIQSKIEKAIALECKQREAEAFYSENGADASDLLATHPNITDFDTAMKNMQSRRRKSGGDQK